MIEKDLRGESSAGGWGQEGGRGVDGKVTGVLGRDKWMRVREREIDRKGLQGL